MPFIATIHKSEQEKRALFLTKIDEFGQFQSYQDSTRQDSNICKETFKKTFEKYISKKALNLHTRI